MKKCALITLLILTLTSTTWAKPGGWIKDLLKNSNNNCNQNRYYQTPVYYYQQPYVCYPAPRPGVYYYPQNAPMQPYQYQRTVYGNVIYYPY